MTAEGLDTVNELKPIREKGWELVSGPAGRLPTEDELVDLLPGVNGWLAGVESISRRALEAADCLAVISRNGVGADAIDVAAAEAQNIRIVLARAANSRGVAELTMTLTLVALRDVLSANGAMHLGEWKRSLGREMPDITMGIIGFGTIGRMVAELANSMGARILAFDPFVTIEGTSVAKNVSFKRIFTECNVITLHCPPPSGGSSLIAREELLTLQPGSVLINTARSALVDDAAVLEALNSELLSTYAVDAFDSEPPELTELLRHPRTIMTPHLGGFTSSSTRRASELAVNNLIATLETTFFQ
jgi:phosphoglycerate dehydrogenase-like enzyme